MTACALRKLLAATQTQYSLLAQKQLLQEQECQEHSQKILGLRAELRELVEEQLSDKNGESNEVAAREEDQSRKLLEFKEKEISEVNQRLSQLSREHADLKLKRGNSAEVQRLQQVNQDLAKEVQDARFELVVCKDEC